MNNYTPTPDFYNDYIAHFGILGQKWGKKNGPPYPLGAGDHSAAEKKAGYTKSKEGKRNTKLYSDGGSGSSSKRKKDYDDLKKKPVNEMTDQEFNKFLKGIDDKEVREYARNKRNKNKPQKQWNEMSKAEQDRELKKELKAESDYMTKRELELEQKGRDDKIKNLLNQRYKASNMKMADKRDDETFSYLKSIMSSGDKSRLQNALKNYEEASKAVDRANDSQYKKAYSQFEKADKQLDQEIKKIVNGIVGKDLQNTQVKEVANKSPYNNTVSDEITKLLRWQLRSNGLK